LIVTNSAACSVHVWRLPSVYAEDIPFHGDMGSTENAQSNVIKGPHPWMCFRFTPISESGSWLPPRSGGRGRARQSISSWHVAWPPEPEEANFDVEAYVHWLWGNSETVLFHSHFKKAHGRKLGSGRWKVHLLGLASCITLLMM
jgi:hypothetical protein